MLVAKVTIAASASVERATEPDWGWCPLHVTRATVLAGASGPVSVLGYFSLHVWQR
jgi:hypothetical protein